MMKSIPAGCVLFVLAAGGARAHAVVPPANDTGASPMAADCKAAYGDSGACCEAVACPAPYGDFTGRWQGDFASHVRKRFTPDKRCTALTATSSCMRPDTA